MTQRRLLILGFGGHARSVADVALACGYTELLFVDEQGRPGENFLGHPVVRQLRDIDGSWREAFPASGDGRLRREQCADIERMGLSLISVVSPLASLGAGSEVRPGCFVGHHAHIGPLAVIGRACIVNTGAIIEHEVSVGDYSHVSVHATIAGRSRFGAFGFLGAGATIADRLTVADGVTIGAGAVVIGDISDSGTYVGVPARKLR